MTVGGIISEPMYRLMTGKIDMRFYGPVDWCSVAIAIAFGLVIIAPFAGRLRANIELRKLLGGDDE